MYYQGSSEIQSDDGLQTLYLMNPNYFGYSAAATQSPPPENMLFLNSPTTTAATVHTLDSDTALPQAPVTQAQQFVGFSLSHHEYPTRPLSGIGGDHQPEIQTSHQNTLIPRFHYHSWGSVDHQSTNGNQPDMSLPQGLSLSLSPNQTPGFNKASSVFLSDQDFGKSSIGLITSSKISSSPSILSTTTMSNEFNSMQRVIMGSKYRKAAQQVLYEVANGIDNDQSDQFGSKNKVKITQDSIKSRSNFKTSSGGGDQGSKSGGPELTAAQRQEIQMKKAKLVTMLDEVEQRYRQYHHRMEMIMASFEVAAGTGSAKTYTQLAFRTISKQFRCLKDAISSQIKSFSESLNEEGNNLCEKFDKSNLKFVDHHLRQQSSLHKLRIVQNNAWKSQRGLPERAVSVLRAWLFEHFLHPYPKDSDKHIMAKQTGLTRSQVSNWFINARVRLWKPMVEEMYLEEMKNQEQINSDDPKNTTKTGTNKESRSKLITAQPQQKYNHTTMVPLQSKKHKQGIIQSNVTNPSTTETQISTPIATTSSIQAGVEPNFVQLITSANMEKGLPDQNNTKKPRQDNSQNCNYLLDHTRKEGVRVNNGEFSTTSSSIYHDIGFRTHGRFSSSVEQLATRGTTGFHGNNVCLTLALPRSESSQFSGHQQNLLSNPRNFEFGTRILETGTVENGSRINGYQSSAASHANIAAYDQNIVDFQNRSKPFPAQLLPDFLASQI